MNVVAQQGVDIIWQVILGYFPPQEDTSGTAQCGGDGASVGHSAVGALPCCEVSQGKSSVFPHWVMKPLSKRFAPESRVTLAKCLAVLQLSVLIVKPMTVDSWECKIFSNCKDYIICALNKWDSVDVNRK